MWRHLLRWYCRVELSDDDQVAMFIEGLKPNNQMLITILNPKNLQHAISIAKTLTTEVGPCVSRRHEEGSRMYGGQGWVQSVPMQMG